MRHLATKLLSTLALLPCFALSLEAREKPKPEPVDGKIHWIYDYDEAKRTSLSTGKPMFVVFRCEL